MTESRKQLIAPKAKTQPKAKVKASKGVPAKLESKRPIGRPTGYTPELGDKICAEIAKGVSVKTICGKRGMPSRETFYAWLRKHDEFLDNYARAKEDCADLMAEEILEIADDGTNDWMEHRDKDGTPVGLKLNNEHVQRSRLRVDSRKWLASKLKPKKYGDKQLLEHTGQDGQAIKYIVEHSFPNAGD